jgi:4-hydroxybenzoate polyprenyltransferase
VALLLEYDDGRDFHDTRSKVDYFICTWSNCHERYRKKKLKNEKGAGCTVNDLYDQDLDKKVERTKTRPLASNQVSQKKAVAFLLGQLSVGLLILLQFNTYSIYVGICSLLFVFTYPLFKRFTYWPQMMLGFTFNWGCFIGYSSVLGYCDWFVTVPLYIGFSFEN